MGDGLGQLLLGVQVTLAAYHDALSLGRTGAVHGFGAVANGRGAQAQRIMISRQGNLNAKKELAKAIAHIEE